MISRSKQKHQFKKPLTCFFNFRFIEVEVVFDDLAGTDPSESRNVSSLFVEVPFMSSPPHDDELELLRVDAATSLAVSTHSLLLREFVDTDNDFVRVFFAGRLLPSRTDLPWKARIMDRTDFCVFCESDSTDDSERCRLRALRESSLLVLDG